MMKDFRDYDACAAAWSARLSQIPEALTLNDDRGPVFLLRVTQGRQRICGTNTIDTDEAQRICEWVTSVRQQVLLLHLVLERKLAIFWPAGEEEPTFSAQKEDIQAS